MPELPEVETIKRGLSAKIIGKKIVEIEIKNEKSFLGDRLLVIGYEVIGIERRAKLIRFRLSNDYNLLFHLKLTGQLIYRQPSLNPLLDKEGTLRGGFAGGHPDHDWHAELPNKHTRIIFTFDDNSKLFFNDLRKFGWCKVLTPQAIEALDKEYGIEPFSKDFTVPNIIVRTDKIGNRKIKEFLMDQKIIAGIGNIYADEILFASRIRPDRRVKDVTKAEWQKIHDNTIKILKLAIKYGGTTDSDYVNAEGKKGGMQDHLKVYHRTNQKCVGCGGVVKRITMGGRGTHFCPECQK